MGYSFNIIFFLCPVFFVRVLSQCKVGRGFPSGEVLSREDHFDGLQYFWMPDPQHHYDFNQTAPTNKRLALYLHDVNTTSDGPIYGSTTTSSLTFTGQCGSYATICESATGESVKAEKYFTWFFRIYSNDTVSGVILEYSDSIGPLRIEQDLANLRVSFGDNLGGLHSVSARLFKAVNSWITVAVTYSIYFTDNGLQIIHYKDPITYKVTAQNVCPVDEFRRINATGCVRIGASFDASLPAFSGRLACLQFYKSHLLTSRVYENVYAFCDPNLAAAQSMVVQDITVDGPQDPTCDVPTASPATESMTTETPTTESMTTELPTTESMITKTLTKESMTTESPTTESMTTETPSTASMTTEPSMTESITSESPSTELMTTESTTKESMTIESSTIKSITTEILMTESTMTESPMIESTTTESLTTESVITQSPTSESVTGELTTTESVTTESLTTETMARMTTKSPSPEALKTESTTETVIAANPAVSFTMSTPSSGKSNKQCPKFKRVAESSQHLSEDAIIKHLPVPTFAGCAHACLGTTGCVAIAYRSNECILSKEIKFIPPRSYVAFVFE